MAAKNKRRRLPEEDLEASIQDILQSPITRVNLAFLRADFGESSGPEKAAHQQAPTAPVEESVGEGLYPMGFGLNQPGVAADLDHAPSGNDLEPMGFVSKPVAAEVNPSGAPRQESAHTLWRAEHLGPFFEESRVRPISRAEDALSTAEQQVYTMLWTAGVEADAAYRLVHFSLQRISTQLKLNIKTVRELLPRLIEKGFIAVEQAADVKRNIATLYRVWSGEAILAAQVGRDRRWVVKTGRGVFYVHRMTVSVTGG